MRAISCDSFAIISHEFRFVNTFFSIFSSFLGLFSLFGKLHKGTRSKTTKAGKKRKEIPLGGVRGERGGIHAHGRDAIPQQVADFIRAVHE